MLMKQNEIILKDSQFQSLKTLIEQNSGIQFPQSKKLLLAIRLQKRLKALDIDDVEIYLNYLFNSKNSAEELVHLIDVVTTNETFFFRESAHFDFLYQKVLPKLVNHHSIGVDRPVNIWSAGCSTGEEPYTIAMVMNEFGKQFEKYYFSVLATDISTRVLKTAKMSVYHEKQIEGISQDLQKEYLMFSRNREKKLVKIDPNLRKHVQFGRLNLIDNEHWSFGKQDIIFCRNVLIYFNKEQRLQLVRKLCDQLNPNGYLFTGHSESLTNLDVPLNHVYPTIYQRTH